MLSLQNHRRLTQLFAVESVALVPEREDDEIHSDFDGYGDDPAKTFTQAPQNGLILPGMVTQIDDENSVSVEPGAARAVEVRRKRSEDRRVGKECVTRVISRWSTDN